MRWNWKKWLGLGLLGMAVLGIGLIIWQLDLPNWQALDLERIRSRPTSTSLYDAKGNELGPLGSRQERVYTELDEIPGYVKAAFIAAEDQRFYEHSGIDIRRIFGALWHDIKTRSLAQGASTITQQLIKLTHLTSEKTLARKAQEIVTVTAHDSAADLQDSAGIFRPCFSESDAVHYNVLSVLFQHCCCFDYNSVI